MEGKLFWRSATCIVMCVWKFGISDMKEMRSNWKMRLRGSDFHIFHSLGSRNPSPTNEEQVISCIELERERDLYLPWIETKNKQVEDLAQQKPKKNFFLLLNWRLWLISSDRPWFQLDKAICRRKEISASGEENGRRIGKGIIVFYSSSKHSSINFYHCSTIPIFFSRVQIY